MGERAVAALNDIGDGLRSVGDSFAALTGESLRQRGAIEDLGAKIDKLQGTAEDIKTELEEDKQRQADAGDHAGA